MYIIKFLSFLRLNSSRLYIMAKWIKLDIIMPSEISHTQRDKYCLFSPRCGIYKSQTQRQRVRCCLPGSRG